MYKKAVMFRTITLSVVCGKIERDRDREGKKEGKKKERGVYVSR